MAHSPVATRFSSPGGSAWVSSPRDQFATRAGPRRCGVHGRPPAGGRSESIRWRQRRGVERLAHGALPSGTGTGLTTRPASQSRSASLMSASGYVRISWSKGKPPGLPQPGQPRNQQSRHRVPLAEVGDPPAPVGDRPRPAARATASPLPGSPGRAALCRVGTAQRHLHAPPPPAADAVLRAQLRCRHRHPSVPHSPQHRDADCRLLSTSASAMSRDQLDQP